MIYLYLSLAWAWIQEYGMELFVAYNCIPDWIPPCWGEGFMPDVRMNHMEQQHRAYRIKVCRDSSRLGLVFGLSMLMATVYVLMRSKKPPQRAFIWIVALMFTENIAHNGLFALSDTPMMLSAFPNTPALQQGITMLFTLFALPLAAGLSFMGPATNSNATNQRIIDECVESQLKLQHMVSMMLHQHQRLQEEDRVAGQCTRQMLLCDGSGCD
jgi:hypothetical protein